MRTRQLSRASTPHFTDKISDLAAWRSP